MIIGVPKERKVKEYRVGMLPETVSILVKKGHKVLVEDNAGLGINIAPVRRPVSLPFDISQ